MIKMQYGAYIFEYNPRRIEVAYSSNIAASVMPGCGSLAQNYGPRCKIVRAEGELFAVNADTALAKLTTMRTACCATTAALLKLPTGEEFSATVSRFSYTAQGDGRLLSYAVEFIEADSSKGSSGI